MQQIHYFLALCEELNFTCAARRCGVSQPSLSNAISALERELGGALFDRKPSIALTGLGRMVRPYLDEIARNADHAREVARTLTPRPLRPPISPSSSGQFAAPIELMPLTLGSSLHKGCGGRRTAASSRNGVVVCDSRPEEGSL